ncbi:MAG: DUF5658 family protein [Candidatus Cloacimonetes bacterium]|nr:DUF5658 family protein [Candidatus Cloacimonadota bacterium]
MQWVLLILLCLLNGLDAHSTWLVVSRSSIQAEKNPLARWMFRRFGFLPGILILKGFVGIVLLLMYFPLKLATREIIMVLSIGCGIYSVVVLNNYRIYRKISRRRHNNVQGEE